MSRKLKVRVPDTFGPPAYSTPAEFAEFQWSTYTHQRNPLVPGLTRRAFHIMTARRELRTAALERVYGGGSDGASPMWAAWYRNLAAAHRAIAATLPADTSKGA